MPDRETSDDSAAAGQEAQQLLRARNGDARAFEWLYRQHVGRIHALCLRLTADPSLAEECTQRAFVRAWRKLGDFRGDSRFGTWLHRIAVNEVTDHHRAAGRRRLREAPLEDPDLELHPVAEQPATQLDLEHCIARLPKQARQVFVLVAVHGHSHEEAAELLGVAPGTCKAQYYRARQLLISWLNLDPGAEP